MRKLLRHSFIYSFALLLLWLFLTFRPQADVTEPVTPTHIIGNDDDYDVGISFSELSSRLASLVEAPILTVEEALETNYALCNKETHDLQVNPDQYRHEAAFWAQVSEEQIRQRRQDILQYFKDQGSSEVIARPLVGSGRGIVMTAGNRDTVERIITTLSILREHYGSHLPVEVFAFAGEIRATQKTGLLRYGAKVIEFSGKGKLRHLWKNFQIKALSIISSSFASVLYLDSDNTPLRDPTSLFDDPTFHEGGRAMFWPDLNKDHPENAIWRLLGKPCDHQEWQIDSGQILIDKRGNSGLNLAALHLAAHMQQEHNFYFKLSGGDKDTFRYAFWALGLNYTVAPRWVSSVGFMEKQRRKDPLRFCGIAMLHYGLDGQPLFLHANLLKHNPPSIRGPVFTTVKRATMDGVRNTSLDLVTTSVRDADGMCADLHGEGVLEEQWQAAFSDELRDFEHLYLSYGGKYGGW